MEEGGARVVVISGIARAGRRNVLQRERERQRNGRQGSDRERTSWPVVGRKRRIVIPSCSPELFLVVSLLL